MKLTFKHITVLIICLFLYIESRGQEEYYSKLFYNDSLAQNGREILLRDTSIYVLSGRRCLPNFQECSSFLKLDSKGKIIYETLLPNLDVGNDNTLIHWNSTFIITGHRTLVEQKFGFYFYQVSLDGEIIDFVHIPLDDSSVINYTSGLNKQTNELFICGALGSNGVDSEIDVDGVIVKYELNNDQFTIENYDNGKIGLDIHDMHPDTDSTLVFLSRRKAAGYQGGHLDWVVEKIYADGSREEIHKTANIGSIDVRIPEFAVLSNGNMIFHLGDSNTATINFRILDAQGNFLFDTELENSFWPNVADAYDIQPLVDGGFLVVGRYRYKVDPITEEGIERNGLLLKIDTEGEIVWLHHYRQFHPETGDYRESLLAEAREMENGDIVALGSVTGGTATDLWLLRVNQDGCLADGACDELVTSVDDVKVIKKYITIYPNPITSDESINVLYNKNQLNPTSVIIQSLDGQVVKSMDYDKIGNHVSTEGISAGTYVLSILEEARVLLSEKVVIR